jgi:pimeloyl-ACP methyl ester carboxylesterase
MYEFDVGLLNDSQTYSGLIDSAEFNDNLLFGGRASGSESISLSSLSAETNLLPLPNSEDIRDSTRVTSLGTNFFDDWITNPYFAQFLKRGNTNNNVALTGDEAVNILGTTNDIDSLTGASYSAQLSGDRISFAGLFDEHYDFWDGTSNTNNYLVPSPIGIGGTIQAADGIFPVTLWEYNDTGRINASINPNQETVVVVHGWNRDGSPYQPKGYLEELTMTIGSTNPNLQVLALDWGKAATDTGILGSTIPLNAAARIRPVAEWAANTLTQLGIAPRNLTLIGHSLGSYLGAEVGSILGGVKNLVALDPAFPTISYDIDGRRLGQQRVTDFNRAATNSLAFFAGESWLGGGIAGEAPQAATANNSFAIDFKGGSFFGNFVNHHSDVIDVFTDAIASGFLTLPSITLPLHQNDWYGHKSEKFNRPTSGHHEGVINATKIGESWDITALNYVDLSGKERSTWVA